MSNAFSQQIIEFDSPAINSYQKYLWTGNINQDEVLDFVLMNRALVNNGFTTLRVVTSTTQGHRESNLLLNGAEFQVQDPEVLIADFTGDGITDLAVFDGGNYDWNVRLNLGLTPQLFVGTGGGDFVASNAFADAIRTKIVPIPSNGYLGGIQTDTTIGIKDVAFADINRDGLLDIWVESTGSKNMTSHFLINRGTYFEVDLNNRIDSTLFFGPLSTDYFRYGMGEFLDINSDTFPDLFLGQIRDNHITHINQTSLLLINDGSGEYPESEAIQLPTPNFYYGFTSVQGVDSFDINRDGLKDLVILHTRNDDVSGPLVETPWTGSFFQVLLQTPDGQFVDRTSTYLADQSAWSSTSNQNARGIKHADLNGDGWNDLIVDYAGYKNNTELPMYFINQQGRQFVVGDSDLLYGDISKSLNLKALNANNDQYIDFYNVLSSSDGSNTITLLLGNSPLGSTNNPSNIINGSIFNDVLNGGALNDFFYGNEGFDRIDGGAGIDTAKYDGSFTHFNITTTGGSLVVIDTKGASGTDTLTNIERLSFSDKSIALDLEGTAGQAYRIYEAVLGRAPDLVGLGYWINDMDNGAYLTTIASGFIASKEFKDKYGANPSYETYINLLYQNILGRAPDAEGLNYWVSNMQKGIDSPAAVLASFSEGFENTANVAPDIANGIYYTPWII